MYIIVAQSEGQGINQVLKYLIHSVFVFWVFGLSNTYLAPIRI